MALPAAAIDSSGMYGRHGGVHTIAIAGGNREGAAQRSNRRPSAHRSSGTPGLFGLELLELVGLQLVLLVFDVVAVVEGFAPRLVGRLELLDQIVALALVDG